MKKRLIILLVVGTYSAFAQGLVTPPIAINGLTHSYSDSNPGGPTTIIEDYAATGQFTQIGFTTTLTGSELITASLEAPAGQMFVIHVPPAGFGNIALTLDAEWASGSDFSLSPVSSSFTFENLVGPVPTLTSSLDGIGAGGKAIGFLNFFTISPGTTFTGIQLSAQYATSISSPSEQAFAPSGFEFYAGVVSSQTLGDGTIMTLENIPEPSVFTLLGLGSLFFIRRHRKF